MKLFFETLSDSVLQFNDGKEIKVNRLTLSMESKIFEKIFTDLPFNSTVAIQDYDSSNFKLFLKVLAGFQDCTAIDALLIFPIAWKYEAIKVINKCMNALKPTELNENLCLALNISLFCKCDELSNTITNFLTEKRLIFKLFNLENYYLLLEPESIAKLLSKINGKIDSIILKNVFKWGKNYLVQKNNDKDLRSFFEENKLDSYFKISCFETTSLFMEFYESDLGKGYFTSDEFFTYIKNFGCDSRKCKYFEVKAMETITEKFETKNVALVSGFTEKLSITRNRLVFYDYPEIKESKMLLWFITYSSKKAGLDVTKEKWESLARHGDTFKKKNFAILELNNVGNNVVTNLKVTVKFQFLFDARILKASSSSLVPIDPNDEELYFVDSISVTY